MILPAVIRRTKNQKVQKLALIVSMVGSKGFHSFNLRIQQSWNYSTTDPNVQADTEAHLALSQKPLFAKLAFERRPGRL